MASTSKPKTLAVPQPSASVFLVSSSNQILLLHRVKTASSFPSAHVFPGGNVSSEQDGELPPEDDPERHRDSAPYRRAAIRECFEESGLLLAVPESSAANSPRRLLDVPQDEREQGRKDVHANRVQLGEWVRAWGGRLDTDGLVPFTRFITPPNLPRRFTTQMYIYLLPTKADQAKSTALIPTPDGGFEHTAARFLPAAEWIARANQKEIVLFPPQAFLLHVLAQNLPPCAGVRWPEVGSNNECDELREQRTKLLRFIHDSDPPWSEICICPKTLKGVDERRWEGGLAETILGMDWAGPELDGLGRKGDSDRVLVVKWDKNVPRGSELRLRSQISAIAGNAKGKL